MGAFLFLLGVFVGLVASGVWTACVDLLEIYRKERR